MRRRVAQTLIAVALACGLPATLVAQDAEAVAIIAVVDRLFEGMRTKDTAMMRALFVPEARMVGVGREGAVRADPIDGWLAGIGRSPATTVLRERTWNHEVKVDGVIAQAWMDYDFYVGGRFSHCGVDAFHFLKVGNAWKIATVMDTRRTEGCTEPPPARR
jgi:hypothetical protein